ncbi:MAG: DUF4388 domain-containing protein [Pyrinomonadaceae bacterium]|nr:DUF4388 domain-containing protein [Pyrinomonadaceae bacterium]
MALSGQLSDLSLAELIEFFCNQRKSGRLKVSYPRAPGFFYFQKGAMVDAKIGALSGVEAVYYALTLQNASFKFSASFEPARRTIHQPWAQVALEGLRRMDEGIAPSEAFPDGSDAAYMEDEDGANEIASLDEDESETALPLPVPAREPVTAAETSSPLSLTVENASGGGRRMMVYGAIAAAVIISIAAVGFPAGWYGKKKAANASQPAASSGTDQQMSNNSSSNSSESPANATAETSSADQSATIGPVSDPAALAAQRAREARERERWRAAQENADTAAKPGASPAASAAPTEAAKKPEPAKPKSMAVQVTYDENGRVTGASGGDANALRIARQKRFPAGKAGSATVTIPVN